MECIVCMCENASVFLEPCGHNVSCKNCTVPALVCSGLKCPICRTLVLNLPYDFYSPKVHSFDIKTTDFYPHVGITLKNSKGGVTVTKLCKNDIGSKYLRKGDVISAINGIPAVHHKSMISLINECSKTRTCMHIEKGSKKNIIHPYLRNLAIKYYKSLSTFHPEWNS